MSDPFLIKPQTIKHRAIPEFGRRWIEDIAPPASAGQNQEQGEFLRRIIRRRHFTFLYIIFVFLFSVILGQVINLQIFQGANFYKKAEANRMRSLRISAERGLITDRNGIILAKNTARFAITINSADLPKTREERKQIIEKIASILTISPETIEEQLQERSNQNIVISDNLSYDSMLLTAIRSVSIQGLNIETLPRREYPQESLFSHVLGYVGKLTKEEYKSVKNKGYFFNDSIGKSGIEAWYEEKLRGKDGIKKVEVDAQGKISRVLSTELGAIGNTITLSLDMRLQEIAKNALTSMLKEQKLSRGAVIVMSPKAEIFALVSAPDYDLNIFPEQKKEAYDALLANADRPFFNRAISSGYPPGSTIKPLIAAAALNENLINERTTFISSGGIRVGSWFFPDWLPGGHGPANVTRAIAESINTFFYILGGGYDTFPGLGLKKIVKYATIWGLGQKTGIDLPGETTGLLPDEKWKKRATGENWYIGDTYHLSIGQGYLLATPLQIANLTATIANGGALYQPSVLLEDTRIIRNGFVKQSAISVVKAGMRETVTSGSGRLLLSLPVPAAGKTGTAEWIKDKKSISWFTGFAPYLEPKIVVTVVIEEGGDGHKVALPVAKEIMERYFKSQNM